MPLFNSRMPPNVGMFFKKLMQIAAFDVIETDELINDILRLPPTDPVNEQFMALGFESVYFINNLGSLFIVFISLVVLMLIYVSIDSLTEKSYWVEQSLQKLKKYLFWDSLIHFMLESYMIISVCCMISLKHSLGIASFGLVI